MAAGIVVVCRLVHYKVVKVTCDAVPVIRGQHRVATRSVSHDAREAFVAPRVADRVEHAN